MPVQPQQRDNYEPNLTQMQGKVEPEKQRPVTPKVTEVALGGDPTLTKSLFPDWACI